ncbi:MAG: hypothetical protein IPK12_16845 [Gemmatimonadetes bacterium]|nr:hypothetical protein [Gemmatimonadota bacterium]
MGFRRLARRTVGWGVAALALGACNDRERLTFNEPPPPGGEGPAITIERPGQDTSVIEGPAVVVSGTVRDPEGVDTFYAEVLGGVTTFPPFPGDDSLFLFALPITTAAQGGEIIQVRLYATDMAGNHSDSVSRVIIVLQDTTTPPSVEP